MNKIKSLFVVLIICFCSMFTACGNPTKFDLDFIVDDEVYATITTAGNSTIEMPENPEKEGYTFDGWYWDKDAWEKPFTANSLLDAPLSSDMKVYAKWTENHEHSYTEEIIAPTCTEQGYTLHTCSCGDNYKDTYTEKIAHLMTEWIEITPASCNHLGLLKRYCEYNCGHIEYDDIDLLSHNEVIDEAVEPTYTQTGLTEGKHCSVCGETLIEQQIVLKKQIAVTSVDGGSINGNNLFILTGKDTTLLQLQNSLTITNNCEWLLYRDSNHTDIITSKVTDILNNGDNVYYIELKTDNTIPTTIKKFYTLTIHRSYEVSINFYNGQTLLKTDTIYTGNTYNIDYVPDLDGYTFNGWVDSHNNPFESHIIWETENYYVSKTKEIYLVSFDKNGGASLFDTMPVTFNESFNFGISSKEHYDFLGWEYNGTLITDANGTGLTTWNIDAEDIVVKARFEGHLYSVSLQTMVDDTTSSSAGNVTGAGTFNYNSQKTITATSNLGYDFVGWYEDDTLISEDISFNYKIPGKNVTLMARWQTEEEMKDFMFSSTQTTCSIIGIVVDKSQITNLKIPEYVTSIGQYAFKDCSKLTSITLPFVGNTLNGTYNNYFGYIFGADHFIKNSTYVPNSLKEVVITGGNSITRYAFYECSNLTSITIPSSVTTIGDYAFNKCSNLSEFIIPNTVHTIGESAFDGCIELTTITIPENIVNLGDKAFGNCSNLKEINYNAINCSDWTSYGDGIFTGVGTNTEGVIVNIGTNVTKIPAYLFYIDQYSNSKIISIVFQRNSVCKTIGERAFNGCNNLTKLILPNSIETIGKYAFAFCRNLNSIVIPQNVEIINNGTFASCDNLNSIYFCHDKETADLIEILESNENFVNADKYYYSLEKPSDEYKSWYFNSKGLIVVWEKE